MNLKPMSLTEQRAIKLHTPLPFSVYDQYGYLLLSRGSGVYSTEHLDSLLLRGVFIKSEDSIAYSQALNDKLNRLIDSNVSIGNLASAVVYEHELNKPAAGKVEQNIQDTWSDMSSRMSAVLYSTAPPGWLEQFLQAHRQFISLVDRDAEAALFILLNDAQTGNGNYAVNHALLVATICHIIGKKNTAWTAADCQRLTRAALTMNLTIMKLQDELSQQQGAPTVAQRRLLDCHSTAASVLLKGAGVTDDDWRRIIQLHHTKTGGFFKDKTIIDQLARVLHRVDIFSARLSARAGRKALNAHDAATNIFRDDAGAVDDAGSMIIKAIGLYPPGCLTRLKNGEIAVSLNCAATSNSPRVASVIGADGIAYVSPIIRDTRQPQFATRGGVSVTAVNYIVNPLKLLKLR